MESGTRMGDWVLSPWVSGVLCMGSDLVGARWRVIEAREKSW